MNKESVTNNIKTPNNNIEFLRKNFSHCFDKNGNFDFEKLKKEIAENNEIDFSKESYGMDWLGKSYARLLATDEATTLLKEDEEWNSKEENKNSENLLIKGDNLEVLKHLSNAYYKEIKMIYIDPPYNTGGDGFLYKDDRKFTVQELSKLAGIDEENAKRILDFTQSKSNSHSAWLTFMYPRLYIAKQLLKDEGVIFISIDDNEIAQLKILMDEIFGEENFIGILSVENNPKGRKNSDFISVSSEYLLVFAKDKQKSYFVENVPKNASDMSEDEDGNYVHNSGKRVLVGENSFNPQVTNIDSEKNYSVYYRETDKTLKIVKEEFGSTDNKLISEKFVKYSSFNNGYLVENTYTESKLYELFEQEALEFSRDKIYEKNFNDTIRIKSQLVNREYEAIVKGKKQKFSLELTTTGAGTYLKNLFQLKEVPFPAPKNIGLLKLLISLFEKEPFFILDFFAGSGTTGDAVMQLNVEDSGNRKYILVQIPEKIDSNKNKTAYDFVKNELKIVEPTIFEITKERLVRAGRKVREDNNNLKEPKDISKIDFGFKIFETTPIWEDYNFEADEFNPELRLFNESKLKDDDIKILLTTWKTYDGIPLTQNLKEIELDGYKGYYFDNKLYLVYKGFNTNNLKKLLSEIDENNDFNPAIIIVFGYNFESKMLREIEENIKNYSNKKHIDIDFIGRY